MEQKYCPYCNFPILDTYAFCPNCGKKFKEPPITLLRQLGLYALSLLLPPLGLFPGIKLLLQKDEKAKIVGLIAIILTIISLIVTVIFTMNLLNSALSQNNPASDQLNQLQRLGY